MSSARTSNIARRRDVTSGKSRAGRACQTYVDFDLEPNSNDQREYVLATVIR